MLRFKFRSKNRVLILDIIDSGPRSGLCRVIAYAPGTAVKTSREYYNISDSFLDRLTRHTDHLAARVTA